MASLHQFPHSCLSSLIHKPTTLFPSKPSPFKIFFSLNPSESDAQSPNPPPEPQPAPVDPVKLAFQKAKAYKKSIQDSKSANLLQKPLDDSANTSIGKDGEDKLVPVSVKVAMEKAEYNNSKKFGGGGGVKAASETETNSGSKTDNGGCNIESGLVEKGNIKGKKLSISSVDFIGLNFEDKKKGRGLPAGLAPVIDPFPEGNLPEVEIIVGDTSKFGDPTTSMPQPNQEDNLDLYKPKVSTWGVFPRPGDISKTFGGGRTIRPGDVLETAEERAAKDEHTKQLIAAYRKKIGLNIDPKLKSECERALKDGDALMDSGKLNEALSYYHKVMNKLPFQSEIHGLAALQWSICLDSLNRPNEARAMYEKLQSHPNAEVSKKARQFMFSFQAMDMMKVSGSNILTKSTGYQNYFEAFIEEKSNYPLGEAGSEEDALSQALPYMFLLVSPIFIVLLIAVLGSNTN